jgi:hypothetical protein
VSADIRVMIIAAACASVLSVLTGLISQVAFWSLVLRALLSGVGFAALAAGALFLAHKFMPEIFGEDSAPEPFVAPAPEPEHRLNIVLPGDGESGVEEAPAEVENLSSSTPEPGNVGDAELRDFDREAEEIGTDTLVPQDATEVEEQPKTPARPPAAFEDLDVLPDLDGLSDSFTAAANEDIDAGSPPERDPISTTGASRDGVDAATMAQAVRTLLKRDQKGQ